MIYDVTIFLQRENKNQRLTSAFNFFNRHDFYLAILRVKIPSGPLILALFITFAPLECWVEASPLELTGLHSELPVGSVGPSRPENWRNVP